MPLKKYTLKPGYELRGFRFRLYPDKRTEELFAVLESDCRRAWNWLVNQTEVVIEARVALALREGLVGLKPKRPDYDGLTPEDLKALRESFLEELYVWHKLVNDATSGRPECRFRKLKEWMDYFGDKFDYQLMTRVIGWKYEGDEQPRVIVPGAHLLQSLVKNYFTHGVNQRRKKFRRRSDPMPVQVRSGECFRLGEFGERRGQALLQLRDFD